MSKENSSEIWRDPKSLGTPIHCKTCGYLDKIRLKKFVSIKDRTCPKCGNKTMARFTEYDQERRIKS